ncbi:MAG: hypothetical protein ACRCSP_02440 [Rhodoglobus sp.]
MNKPSRKDRTRPFELLVLSVVLGAFVGFVVLMATREIVLAFIFFCVSCIVSLVALAMLSLAAQATGAEKIDLAEQDDEYDLRSRGH